MGEERYDIELMGFEEHVSDPAAGLQRMFGVDRYRAEQLLDKAPLVVRRNLSHQQADKFLKAFKKIGAFVNVVPVHRTPIPAASEADSRDAPKASSANSSPWILSKTSVDSSKSNGESRMPSLRWPSAQKIESPQSGKASTSQKKVPEAAILKAVSKRTGEYTPPPTPSRDTLQAVAEQTSWEQEEARERGVPSSEAESPWIDQETPSEGPNMPVESERSPSQPFEPLSFTPIRSPGSIVLSQLRGALGGILIAAIGIIAVVIGLTWWSDKGTSSQLEQRLNHYGTLYLPSFDVRSTESEQIAGNGTERFTYEVPQGYCFGWVATTLESGSCDLDLKLYRDETLLTSDIAYDNYPIIFHCAHEITEVQLRLENAGSDRCSFGLATFEKRGSVVWPLESYLDLYSRWMGFDGVERRWEPFGEIQHGHLLAGERVRRSIVVPASTCLYFLAVSQQGSDLDLHLFINNEEVSQDTAGDNFPIVSTCAGDRDLFGNLEFEMKQGESDLVWQSYVGDSPEG